MKKTYKNYTDALTGQVDDFDLVTGMVLNPNGTATVTGTGKSGNSFTPEEETPPLEDPLFLSSIITGDMSRRKK